MTFTFYAEIYIENDNGSCEGYVTETSSEQPKNWLENRHKFFGSNMLSDFKNHERIAFLNNINVNADMRGKGHGVQLIDDFLTEAANSGAEAVYLYADLDEEQENNLSLEHWYLNQGFEPMTYHGKNPIMKKV